PNTPSTLYAGTQTGMFKSTNGGDTWVSINNGTNSARINEIVLDPTNTAILYIGAASRGMMKSTNAGAGWSSINSGGLSSFSQINALAIDPVNPMTLYAATSAPNALFKTTDGGGSWSSSSDGLTVTIGGQTFTANVNTLAIDPTTPATIYAASAGGAV